MSVTGTHIISSLSWNTSFDSKERAAELQERLSSWCKRKAQQIFREVLDKLCPPDQSWKIDALELDLGGIDYNNLESELSLRVRRQLTEKLTDLLLHAQHSSGGEIQIHDLDIAQLLQLERFLLEGVMPWNQSSAGITAEQMMDVQLRTNRKATVEMLWRAGATHEYVRKRMAWQFSHPVVQRIIEGLEPEHHEEITSFSAELVRTQKEETIVQGSTETFRKDIALWVLNYLFDERGTLFNRVAFMESTLRQMAAHHNVRYEKLFEQIQQALAKVGARRKVAADFMLTLKALSDEKQTTQPSAGAADEFQTDHWFALRVLLRDPELRNTQKARFNGLVKALAKENAERFLSLIETMGNAPGFWKPVIAHLDEAALEVVLFAVSPTQAERIIEGVHFMQQLARRTRNIKSESEIPEAALLFALTHTNRPLDYTLLLDYFLPEGEPDVQQWATLYVHAGEVPVKTIAAAGIGNAIRKKMMDRAERSTTFIESFMPLLELYQRQLNRRTMDVPSLERLQHTLAAIIRLHPARAFEQLSALVHTYDMTRLLLHFLDHAGLRELIRKAKPELHKVISVMEDVFSNLPEKPIVNNQRMVTSAIEWILRHPRGSAEELWSVLLSGIRDQPMRRMIAASAKRQNAALPVRIEQQLKNETHTAQSGQSLTEEVSALMRGSSSAQMEMEELLQRAMHRSAFVLWTNNADNISESALEYLIPGGARLMKETLRAFTNGLRRRLPVVAEAALTEQLRIIFWECVIAYSHHKGSRTHLLDAFRAAVLMRFPLSSDDVLPAQKVRTLSEHSSATEHVLHSGEVLKTRQLFLLLEKCLSGTRTEVQHGGKNYQLEELFRLVVQLQPAEVRRILSSLPASPERIALLRRVISFEEFSAWMVSDLRIDVARCVEAMQWFSDVAGAVSGRSLPEKLTQEYWKELWQVMRTGSFTQDDMKRLIRSSLTTLSDEMDVNVETIATLIREKKITLHPFLRAELIHAFPVLNALPKEEREPKHSATLIVYQQKGLLAKLTAYLVTQRQVPSWLGTAGTADAAELLDEILQHHPSEFLQVIRREMITEQQMQWLSSSLKVKTLAQSIGQLHRDKQSQLTMVADLGGALRDVRIAGLPAAVLQEIIFRKLITAWKSGNWKIISSDNIWNELLWEVCVKYAVPRETFVQAVYKSRTLFPPALQLTFEQLRTRVRAAQTTAIKPEAKKKKLSVSTLSQQTPVQGIAVRNAGIVLLSSYVQTLFTRLGLVDKGKFISSSLQADAVHYLQYVITGLSRTDEALLPLNKVFCGLPLSHPVAEGIAISEEHRKLMDGLIKAAIGHWPAIEGCTLEAFRGNWLVRDGILSELPDKWELRVEKRPYDVLIQRSPFAFSIIRYPWMDKPLHVTWRY